MAASELPKCHYDENNLSNALKNVIPAHAGIQRPLAQKNLWTPASAGVTVCHMEPIFMVLVWPLGHGDSRVEPAPA